MELDAAASQSPWRTAFVTTSETSSRSVSTSPRELGAIASHTLVRASATEPGSAGSVKSSVPCASICLSAARIGGAETGAISVVTARGT